MPRKKQTEKLVTSLNRDDLLELLKAFNELRGIRERALEMHDLYLSDVDKLYSIERTISEKFRFKPQTCEEHNRASYYGYYVLIDDSKAYLGGN